MRRIAGVLVVVSAAVAIGARIPATAQGSGLAAARVSHIGVIVPDMDVALRHYARVMGFPMAKANTVAVPMPDGRKAEIKLATLYMPNFYIELTQPVNAIGPYHDHQQAHGMSIQHIGLVVPGPGGVDDVRGALEQQGGRWTLGAKGAAFAFVSFQPTLGTTLEVNRSSSVPPTPPLSASDSDALPPLAALPVGHVGFAATDTAAVVNGFAKAVGTMPPKVMEYKDAQYPPDAKWSRSAYLRLAFWSQGGMGLEAIESVGGPTPWSEYVAQQKGTAAQHLAINVGNRMDEMIRDLIAKGGKWTNGKPGGAYAYLDFMDTLGIVFELNGTSKSATPAR